jgi:hypothetical protein
MKTYKNCIHYEEKTKLCKKHNHLCIETACGSDVEFAKLDFVLTHSWFDALLKGLKKTEYRRATPFWNKRKDFMPSKNNFELFYAIDFEVIK